MRYALYIVLPLVFASTAIFGAVTHSAIEFQKNCAITQQVSAKRIDTLILKASLRQLTEMKI